MVSLVLLLQAGLSAFAEESSKRVYNLPADAADRALKLFSEQSGRGLLITTEVARGVRTKAVKGEFTPREAIDQMLANTGLEAAQDEKNGAFVVKRIGNATGRKEADRASRDHEGPESARTAQVTPEAATAPSRSRETISSGARRENSNMKRTHPLALLGAWLAL